MPSNQHWLRPDRGIFPLSEVAKRSAEDFGDKAAMRYWNGSDYSSISYNEFRDRSQATAKWLIDWGIKKGDRVAVLAENRPEWGIAYFGLLSAGAIAIPVDRLLNGSGIRHILSDSEVRVLFTTSKYIDILEEKAPLKTLEKIVAFDKHDEEGINQWDDVIEKGSASNAFLPEMDLEDTAAILYTSGTTGHSKGVMLSHRNILKDAALSAQAIDIGPEDTFLSVLPLHHSYECTLGLLAPLYVGASITYSRSLKSKQLLEDIKNTNVTIMVAVPLLYEKMHAGIVRGIHKKGKFAYKLFKFIYTLVVLGEKLGLSLGQSLFRAFRKAASFGSFRFMICGGGPLDPGTSKFFNRFGIYFFQGYGLTETSPMTHYTHKDGIRHDSVGIPYPDIECKLINIDDNGIGEICIRGPVVFKGYYKNEEATKNAFDEDGWFHTGDLGIIHENDYLQITGRKKNLIVTGGGKNVYPEEIEYDLNKSEFIHESLVLGKKRDSGYGENVSALIFPDYDRLDSYFEKTGKKATEEDVHLLLKNVLKNIQADYPDYKRIKKFRVVTEEFQKTSTRKVKRFLYSGDMVDALHES